MGVAEFPAKLLEQLSCLPEEPPPPFTCSICAQAKDNRWHHSPKDFERPPVCQSCETVSGYRWNGGCYHRTPPRCGHHRDKRNVLRIGALADAIAHEAQRIDYHGRS